MARNIIERQIVPDLPKVIDNEQISVYVPIGSSTKPGLLKFDVNDFVIDSNGKASLRYSQRNIIRNADPLTTPSVIKLKDDEFEYTYSDATSPHSEVMLIRAGLDARIKPQLVMLDPIDFEQRDYDADQLAANPAYANTTGYLYYRLIRKNPYNTATIMKIDSAQFDYQVAGDAKLRFRYPYAGVGVTTYNTQLPTAGFGFVKPKLDWFKFDVDGSLKFDEQYLSSFISDPTRNPQVPEILPIYGAVRDLQPWANKDLFIAEDGTLRPYAVRDLTNEVTGLTPSKRIRIEITKESVGLSKLVNKSFNEWTFNEFGDVMKSYFASQFASKLNASTWAAKFNDYDTDITPFDWLTELEGRIEGVEEDIALQNSYLGVFATDTSLPTPTLVGQNALVLSTNTIWYVNSSFVWTNSGASQATWHNIMETSAAAYQPDGTASAGDSGKWPQSNHIHPTDLTRFERVLANTMAISINADGPVDALIPATDFQVKVTSVYEDDLPLVFTRLNIPYVPEGQYLHNWASQPTDYDFVKGSGLATEDDYKGKFLRFWVGTKQDLADDFAGVIPDDVIVNILDDYTYKDETEEIYTRLQVETYVTEQIGIERLRGWSRGGTLDANVRYILLTTADEHEASMVPLDLSVDLAPYAKKTLQSIGDGDLLETESIFYNINGKRIITLTDSGEIGLSDEETQTSHTLYYKGKELLTHPTSTASSLFLYKNGIFSQMTRADVDSVYALSVNPMILPVRLLDNPPENVVLETTYTKLSDMILGVDVRTANKMPLIPALQGEGDEPVFFGGRNGQWTQFSKSLNINNHQSLIGDNSDFVGSIGKDLYDIDEKANQARLTQQTIIYASTGYGYDAYANADMQLLVGTDWELLLANQTGVSVTNVLKGDAVVARRIGLTSSNAEGNNRSSFNMRTIICRDVAHRDAIYAAMGVNSDRDNILFMWPEN